MKSDADTMQYLSAIEYFWAVELARKTQKIKKKLWGIAQVKRPNHSFCAVLSV